MDCFERFKSELFFVGFQGLILFMIGGLQLSRGIADGESDEPGDSIGLALIEQILLSRNLSIPDGLVPSEIKEEVDSAIEDALDSRENKIGSIENAINKGFQAGPDDAFSEISIYRSANIMNYWQICSEDSLNPYYETELGAVYDSTEEYIAEETKQFATAAKENYNARLKNELGADLGNTELSSDEKERTFTFKVMNPCLWKWMYEASSFLVLNRVTTG